MAIFFLQPERPEEPKAGTSTDTFTPSSASTSASCLVFLNGIVAKITEATISPNVVGYIVTFNRASLNPMVENPSPTLEVATLQALQVMKVAPPSKIQGVYIDDKD